MMSGIMNKEPASSLLDMALEIQKDKGWISDDDVKELARRKGMPESQTYEALSWRKLRQSLAAKWEPLPLTVSIIWIMWSVSVSVRRLPMC